MQKKRPRRTGRQTAPEGAAEQTPVGAGRPTHVRTRLIVAVAVVAAAIAGAGAPALLGASRDLSESQELATLSARTQDALALAHSLADERDEVTAYVAAGRPQSKAPSEERGARVDRQVEDLRADTGIPARLRADLDGIAAVRRTALTGKTDALQTHQAYSATITDLHRLATELAEKMPPRAGTGGYALAELDTAVQQSAAARGLLLAALSVPSTPNTVVSPVTGLPVTTRTTSEADRKQRDALTAAAQQARLRADSSLADFRATGTKQAVTSFDSTVTGTEVNSADKYLAALTDQPALGDSELNTSPKKLDATLSARVDLMRGAEQALYDRRTKDLAQLRDDDVTALEIRVAALGVLMLVAVGIATGMARTLTRPLSVLRRGSARLAGAEDPTAEQPIAFTGRNDEFAQVVRSVNALHAHAVALHERIATLEADRKHLVGQRQKMADAREQLRTELSESAAQLERLRTSIGGTFVNLALRTLGLVERQLSVIEGLEEREQDPERLATLFKLDHFATVMRRHSENLLVLSGTEHVLPHPGPVPLVDVVRAAVSEIERYERVRIAALPPHAHVAGFAADDLSHLLAELMENASSFSPPDLPVEVSGWMLESGEVMLSVQDEGIGMTTERMDRLNSRLAEFDPESPYEQEGADGLGLGLYVVARLAHRHGIRVKLREQKQGGVAAVVVLPEALLAETPVAAIPHPATRRDTTQSFSLPGADAEANSNVLRGRDKGTDPLVALAEKAVRDEAAGRVPPLVTETTMELLLPETDADAGTKAGAKSAKVKVEAKAKAEAEAKSADAGTERPAAEPQRTDAGARRADAEAAEPSDEGTSRIAARSQRLAARAARADDWPGEADDAAAADDRSDAEAAPSAGDAARAARRAQGDDWPGKAAAPADTTARRAQADDAAAADDRSDAEAAPSAAGAQADDWPGATADRADDEPGEAAARATRRAQSDDWPDAEAASPAGDAARAARRTRGDDWPGGAADNADDRPGTADDRSDASAEPARRAQADDWPGAVAGHADGEPGDAAGSSDAAARAKRRAQADDWPGAVADRADGEPGDAAGSSDGAARRSHADDWPDAETASSADAVARPARRAQADDWPGAAVGRADDEPGEAADSSDASARSARRAQADDWPGAVAGRVDDEPGDAADSSDAAARSARRAQADDWPGAAADRADDEPGEAADSSDAAARSARRAQADDWPGAAAGRADDEPGEAADSSDAFARPARRAQADDWPGAAADRAGDDADSSDAAARRDQDDDWPVGTDGVSAPVGTDGVPASAEREWFVGEGASRGGREEFVPQARIPAPRSGDAPGEGAVHGRAAEETEAEDRLTAKGLPKRTPKITAPEAPAAPRGGSVDAEALRRRLGGFRRGAQAGYRDVEAEIADKTGRNERPATGEHVEEATGGPAEEASS
ncbi:nitrate- and nitrite sensing domain-containing protein [Streptomyces sp. NPDC005435]|uniref:sensor histidine kinase n=1 Tax=Streptomyces sp. NPDC005435 TaxID=3154464 RepID=UPI003455C542